MMVCPHPVICGNELSIDIHCVSNKCGDAYYLKSFIQLKSVLRAIILH